MLDNRLAALMPVRFNALVIETTNRCNAKCAMCYQSSGPKGHDQWGKHSMDRERLVRIIEEAPRIPNLDSRLHIAGGEAFLNANDVYALVEAGRRAGFADITLTTNAFWGVSAERALSVCERLSDAGVTGLEISWDFWHLEYIQPECVSRVLGAAQSVNISTNLRILTTKRHSVHEAIDLLGDGVLHATIITHGPVFRSGRAVSQIDPDEFYRKGVTPADNCHAALNLALNSTGDAFPCCAGIDQTKGLGLGNAKDESIVDIARRMSQNLWIKKLVFGGVLSVERIVTEGRGDAPAIDEEDSMCSRCWSLFSDEQNVAVVKKYSENLEHRLAREIEARMGA